MANIITLKDINKEYGNKVKTKVLKEINLTFEEGSFNAIIGQSGSGKSTLLNIIGHLDQPTSGEIYFNGRSTKSFAKRELAKLRNEYIGFVFQFHHLLPEFTALENILLPYRMNHKKVTSEVLERAELLIDKMGLKKVKNNLVTNMSGGQQQRTAIARALINEPKVILADEPTGNLDSNTTKEVYDLLKSINEQVGTTFIVITHDERIAKKADRIIEINDGYIIDNNNVYSINKQVV